MHKSNKKSKGRFFCLFVISLFSLPCLSQMNYSSPAPNRVQQTINMLEQISSVIPGFGAFGTSNVATPLRDVNLDMHKGNEGASTQTNRFRSASPVERFADTNPGTGLNNRKTGTSGKNSQLPGGQ